MVVTVKKVARENRLIIEHIHTIKITSYRRLDVGELIAKVSSKTKYSFMKTSLIIKHLHKGAKRFHVSEKSFWRRCIWSLGSDLNKRLICGIKLKIYVVKTRVTLALKHLLEAEERKRRFTQRNTGLFEESFITRFENPHSPICPDPNRIEFMVSVRHMFFAVTYR